MCWSKVRFGVRKWWPVRFHKGLMVIQSMRSNNVVPFIEIFHGGNGRNHMNCTWESYIVAWVNVDSCGSEGAGEGKVYICIWKAILVWVCGNLGSGRCFMWQELIYVRGKATVVKYVNLCMVQKVFFNSSRRGAVDTTTTMAHLSRSGRQRRRRWWHKSGDGAVKVGGGDGGNGGLQWWRI